MVECRLVNETDYEISEEAVCSCIQATAEEQRVESGTVALVMVLPRKMRALNRRYYGKDKETDVLTFADREEENYLGEIIVNPAYLEATDSGNTFLWELCHVAVHGMFHLLGVHHEDGSEHEHADLHKREIEIINNVLNDH